jgi:hypothetical protein
LTAVRFHCRSYAIDVQETIEETRKCKQNKYEYKANMNKVIGVLKDRLVLALTLDDSDGQAALIHYILKEISSYVVPVRQNSSAPMHLFFHLIHYMLTVCFYSIMQYYKNMSSY